MDQPEGFVESGKDTWVCRLKKSLYGLKQSSRQWYKRFDAFIIAQGYIQSPYDSCVYYKKVEDGSRIYLLLYMDDMLVASKNKAKVQTLKSLLGSEFKMKDLGAAEKIFGIEIRRDRVQRKLFLCQEGYILKVLKRFGMNASKPISTPLTSSIRLSKLNHTQSEAEKEYMARIPYTSVVGSLMYAMVCTRPDLAQAVGVVSRFMSNPRKKHWFAVKRILRYLKGTPDIGLVYRGDNSCSLTGYSDFDFVADLDARRSVTGYAFTIGNSLVSWKATLQPTVAL